MKVVWLPQASQALLRIAQNIAIDKPTSAVKWAKEVKRKVTRLAHFPFSGRIVPEIGRREIREIIAGNHRILYKVDTKGSILLVFHSTKDWE